MSKSCDFYIERNSKMWCAVKKDEIEYTTYKEYCKYAYTKYCPIFQFYEKIKKDKI